MIETETLKKILLEKQFIRSEKIFERERILPKGDRIVAIIGPRRSGKTYYFFQIMEKLRAKILNPAILYINFEDERLFGLETTDLDRIIETYFSIYPENKKIRTNFFFDEIQNAPNWQKFIRRLFDKENCNIYLSGSSAKLLGKEIATELRGRSFSVIILPLSFREYLKAQGVTITETSHVDSNRFKIKKQFETYLRDGGFPETVGVEEYNHRIMLQDYFETVLFRDVIERFPTINPETAKYVFHNLANNFARPFSVNKIYNQLKSLNRQISKDTLYELVAQIENSMYYIFVPQYSDSFSIKSFSPKKTYLIDNGLPICLLGPNATDKSRLYENLVAVELIRRGYELTYLIGKEGECDFIAYSPVKKKYFAVQVTLEPQLEREMKGMDMALKFLKLNENDGLILTEEEDKKAKTPMEHNVRVLPLWKWLLFPEGEEFSFS